MPLRAVFVFSPRRKPPVNVGAELLSPVVGPLNYRVSSYQIAVLGNIRVRPASIKPECATLRPEPTRITILTLNGFNLDTRVEDPGLVQDPRRDIDDDVGDGRYEMLAAAIARDAAAPDIVALQEMQDNDGAEITDVVNADEPLPEAGSHHSIGRRPGVSLGRRSSAVWSRRWPAWR